MDPYLFENDSPDIDLQTLIDAGKLESAQVICDRTGIIPDRQKIDARISGLTHQSTRLKATGNIRKARRLLRRASALEVFRDHGLDPKRLIQPILLPAGYEGKILLVIISGPRVGRRVCLRSGDDWHREILKNSIDEMTDLGFEDVAVTPAGGAHVRFNGPKDIILSGGSDDYGACDRDLAASLITGLFPKINVRIFQ